MSIEKAYREDIWLIAFDSGTVSRAVTKAMSAQPRVVCIARRQEERQLAVSVDISKSITNISPPEDGLHIDTGLDLDRSGE
jgi:hypothetical protein